MANQVTNYQCPSCTGPLHFGSNSGMLECDYCGSSFSVEDIEHMYAEKNAYAEAAGSPAEGQPAQENLNGAQWDLSGADEWNADGDAVQAYNCPSCGAELLYDATTVASSCPYCGNPTVIPGKVSGIKKPDLIIPFQVDKKAAVAALKKHYQHKPLLPKAFSSENHIQEIKGVYVPFWLFNAEVEADMTFNCTRSHVRTTPKETITETDHFLVHRTGTLSFENVPVDGSSQMPDGHMDAIEPFSYQDLRPFSLSYLPGFIADSFDIGSDESMQRANNRCASSTEAAFRSTVQGYGSVVCTHKNMTVHPQGVKYAMLPVWLLSTKWNNKNYLFAMNGQTGKLIGDLPIDKGKLFAFCAGAFASVSAIAWAILHFVM